MTVAASAALLKERGLLRSFIPGPARSDRSAISEVVLDSRRVRAGSLFAALVGQHRDGHDFIPQAVAAGA
ncbi:MAG: Mur ligase domain-containing protein, partial [Candidatus Limnocylindrales bacterium]